jgi:hypothetical protein
LGCGNAIPRESCPLELSFNAGTDVLHPATIHAQIPVPGSRGRAKMDRFRLVIEEKFHIVDEP